MTRDEHNITAEDRQSLWRLTAAPAIWGAHFLISYAIAAIWCGRMGRESALGWLQICVVGLGMAALAGILLVGHSGWVRHRHGDEPPPHSADTAEDRHRFLGFATLLLSGLSAVATTYVTIAVLFFGDCR